MNYEQKYKEALEKARQLCAYPTTKPFISDLQDLFPELKEESENEKVIRDIKVVLECSATKFFKEEGKMPIWYDRAVAWLEKQGESDETKAKEFLINKGYPIDTNDTFPTYEEMYNIIREGLEQQSEQNHDDKIEPKFKVGDWIVFNGLTLYINEVVQGYYRTISIGGTPNSYDWDIDNAARLWTIKDATDGDVLAVDWYEGDDSWEKIIIFKKYHNKGIEGLINAPCVEGYGNTYKNRKIAFVDEEVPYFSKTWTDNLHPATKEQRELLFEKMQETDYEWNAEKKVLEGIKPKFHVGDWIVSTLNGSVYKIIGLSYFEYEIMSNDGYKANLHIKIVDDNFNLWTIENAKEGDVLCTYECGKPKIVFILKGTPKKPYVLSYYCYYNIMHPYFKTDSEKGCLAPNMEDLKPATKEQRDLLFQKMKESGYEWDANKK